MSKAPVGTTVYSRLPHDVLDYRIVAGNWAQLSVEMLRPILFKTFGLDQRSVESEPSYAIGVIADPRLREKTAVALRNERAPYFAKDDPRPIAWTGIASVASPVADRHLIPPSALLASAPAARDYETIVGTEMPGLEMAMPANRTFVRSLAEVIEGMGIPILSRIAAEVTRQPVNLSMGFQSPDENVFGLLDAVFLLVPPATRAVLCASIVRNASTNPPETLVRFGLLQRGSTMPRWSSTAFDGGRALPGDAYEQLLQWVLTTLSVEQFCDFATRFAYDERLDTSAYSGLLSLYCSMLSELMGNVGQAGKLGKDMRTAFAFQSELRLTHSEISALIGPILAFGDERDAVALDANWRGSYAPLLLDALRTRLEHGTMEAARPFVQVAVHRSLLLLNLGPILEAVSPIHLAAFARIVLAVSMASASGQLVTLDEFNTIASHETPFAAALLLASTEHSQWFVAVAPMSIAFVLTLLSGKPSRRGDSQLHEFQDALSRTTASSLQSFRSTRRAAVCWDFLMVLCSWPAAFLPLALDCEEDEFEWYVTTGSEFLRWIQSLGLGGANAIPKESSPPSGSGLPRRARGDIQRDAQIGTIPFALQSRLEQEVLRLARDRPNVARRLKKLCQEWGLAVE